MVLGFLLDAPLVLRYNYKEGFRRFYLLWQLAATARLVPARVATNGTALAAPVAVLNLPAHAPITALAIAQLPQYLEPAA